MIQYIIVISIIIISAVYIILRLKNTAKNCDSSKCGSCGYFDNCTKGIKKSRE